MIHPLYCTHGTVLEDCQVVQCCLSLKFLGLLPVSLGSWPINRVPLSGADECR